MTFHDSPNDIPDPEVVPKAKRHTFSAEYKLRISDESDNCTEPGQIGSLLRRKDCTRPTCRPGDGKESKGSLRR